MRVLIVEDDMAIAGSLGPMISEAGHSLVGLAADRDTAVALLRSSDVDLAMVDLKLQDGWTGVDVARAAQENGVAVVFTTANPAMLSPCLGGATGLIEKPYRAEGIKSALDYLGAVVAGDPVGSPPRCLRRPDRAITAASVVAPRPQLSNRA